MLLIVMLFSVMLLSATLRTAAANTFQAAATLDVFGEKASVLCSLVIYRRFRYFESVCCVEEKENWDKIFTCSGGDFFGTYFLAPHAYKIAA
jgi:hypothetical protein